MFLIIDCSCSTQQKHTSVYMQHIEILFLSCFNLELLDRIKDLIGQMA